MADDLWSAADDPAALREKKAALVEVIELQRSFIASRGDGDAAANEDASAGSQIDDDDLRWYTEQQERLDKFKAALNALRLQPDEFPVLVPLRIEVVERPC